MQHGLSKDSKENEKGKKDQVEQRNFHVDVNKLIKIKIAVDQRNLHLAKSATQIPL